MEDQELNMIVQPKRNIELPRRLRTDVQYLVLAISIDAYRILNSDGDPVLYDSALFDIIDSKEPSNWITEYGEDNTRYCEPRELERYAWEDYHDEVPEAVNQVSNYLKKTGPCSWPV